MERPARRPLQNSSFLNLPNEIRNRIYHFALVREKPIDLWPQTHRGTTCHVLLLPSPLNVTERKYRRVRYQEDLLYVREEMAVGILRACYQTFKEASGIFWMENHFRFSGRGGWQGLLRFFLTIGPLARAWIRKISVHAPLYLRWSERTCNSVHSNFEPSPSPTPFLSADLDGLSKNWPKMHMARIKSEEQPESEARQLVCAMINKDRSLEDLFFIIPDGFRNGDLTDYGGYEVGLWGETTLLNKIRKLDFLKITVIFEEGSYLAVENGVDSITRQGWDLICMPGSLVLEIWDGNPVGRLLEEEEVWKASEDFGLKRLFDDD